MLKDQDAMATIAVKDLNAARKFYEETLGLERLGEATGDTAIYRSGSSKVLVYVSQYAGTNQETAATWNAGSDVDGTVKDLKAKGVKFEHYDFPDSKREGDIHIFGTLRVAWLKDPDGNILALVSE